MGLQLSYDLLTAIQNRASLALKEWTVPTRDPGSPSLLLDALNREDTTAPELDLFDASPLLDRLDLGGLVGEGDTTPDVRQWLTGAIGNLGGLHGVAHVHPGQLFGPEAVAGVDRSRRVHRRVALRPTGRSRRQDRSDTKGTHSEDLLHFACRHSLLALVLLLICRSHPSGS